MFLHTSILGMQVWRNIPVLWGMHHPICFFSPKFPSLFPHSRLVLTREHQLVSWGLFAGLPCITSLIIIALQGTQRKYISQFYHPQCHWAWSELQETILLGMRGTHLLKQCAAVRTQQLLRRVAPQSSRPSPWDDFNRREACQGQAPLEAKPHIWERRRGKKASGKTMTSVQVKGRTQSRVKPLDPSYMENGVHINSIDHRYRQLWKFADRHLYTFHSSPSLLEASCLLYIPLVQCNLSTCPTSDA